MPICMETGCIPMSIPDCIHIYVLFAWALAWMSLKIISKNSKFEILCWLLFKIFLEDVSLTLATGHTSNKNKAFIILQWQVLGEQKSVFANSQCTNPAPHIFGAFQCGRVWLLILFQITIFHFSVLKEEGDATWISVGQLSQIPFLVLVILHAWQEWKKQDDVLYNLCNPSLGQVFSWQYMKKTFPNSDLASALK